MTNKERIRRGMADEIIGYLKHHGEQEAAEIVDKYKRRHTGSHE